jgi:hypothetical protein
MHGKYIGASAVRCSWGRAGSSSSSSGGGGGGNTSAADSTSGWMVGMNGLPPSASASASASSSAALLAAAASLSAYGGVSATMMDPTTTGFYGGTTATAAAAAYFTPEQQQQLSNGFDYAAYYAQYAQYMTPGQHSPGEPATADLWTPAAAVGGTAAAIYDTGTYDASVYTQGRGEGAGLGVSVEGATTRTAGEEHAGESTTTAAQQQLYQEYLAYQQALYMQQLAYMQMGHLAGADGSAAGYGLLSSEESPSTIAASASLYVSTVASDGNVSWSEATGEEGGGATPQTRFEHESDTRVDTREQNRAFWRQQQDGLLAGNAVHLGLTLDEMMELSDEMV